jgi:penicillin-binding protein 1A
MKEPLTVSEPHAADGERYQGRKATLVRRRYGTTRRFVRGVLGALLAIGLLVATIGGAGGYFAWQRFSADLPDVDGLRNYRPPVMSRVYAGDSRLMAELATERRIFVPYSAIPDIVKHAFISAEDQHFWTHPGVDPLAIIRAAAFNLSPGSVWAGATPPMSYLRP